MAKAIVRFLGSTHKTAEQYPMNERNLCMQDKQVRKKRKKWPWILLCAILVLAVALFAGMRGRVSSSYQEEIAKKRDISTYYSFSGNLTPVTDKQQTAKEALKVKELYVEEGDVVDEGQALLRASDGTRVYAICTGTVETLSVEKDDQLQPGSPIARIVDYDTLEVSVDVDEYDVDALSLGKEGEVYINAIDKTVPGRVSEISRSATVTGGVSYYAVKLEIGADESIRSGMSADVNVLKDQALSAVSLPVKALSYDEYNKPFVLVKENDKMVTRAVTLGVSDGLNVQILSGVSQGESIYYTANDMLRFFAMQRDMRSSMQQSMGN
ncbi:MAG: HlyD family efflux transporter periplasmic adaptor subunit [Clostridia bacterium]|nr:HlyD family efflux transporter periplasmic adaptor subunit [Clostridia bacterium]